MLPAQLEPLATVVPGACAAGAVALLLARLRRERAPDATEGIGWEGAALALAAALGSFLLRGWHGFPPTNVHAWPFFAALAAAVLALCAGLRWRFFTPLALILVGALLPGLLTVPLREWKPLDATLWIAAFAGGWLLLIAAARGLATRLPDLALPAWAGALAAAGWLIADPVTAKHHGFGLAGAGVAAGVLALARLVWRERIAPRSAAVALAAVVPAWLILAQVMTDRLPALALAPLAAAPLLGAVASWPLARWRWPAAIAAFAIAGACAASAWFLLPPAPEPMGW
jgi:hypothetical protein